MTGSVQIRKRSSGKKYLVIVLRFKNPETGEWISKEVSTGLEARNNKKRAEAMMEDIIAKYAYLETPPKALSEKAASEILVSEYLDIWLHGLIVGENGIRQSTYDGYAYRVGCMKKYFQPLQIKIGDLSAKDVKEFVNYCLTKGKVNKATGERTGLKPRSVGEYKNILFATCNQAIIDGILLGNPVSAVKMSKSSKRKSKQKYIFLSTEEIRDFMNFLSQEYPHLVRIAFVAIYYGLRRSEILGLKWDAVDFKKGLLHIRHTVVRVKRVYDEDDVKTPASERDLDLFATAAQMFREQYAKQQDDRDFFGDCYLNTNNYVFCNDDGHPYDPNNLTRQFRKAFEAFGRPELTLHQLRHTCASILIDNGWDIKKVQYWLGHEDIETTLNIYAHYIRSKNNKEGSDVEKFAADISHLITGPGKPA